MKNEAAARRLAERTINEGQHSGDVALASWLIAALDELQAMRAAPSTPKTKPPEVCGWIMDGDAGLTCDRKATRGTMATGPLCDEHGEEHERESEGR